MKILLKKTNKIEVKNINEDNINRINSYQKITIERNEGIDLLRIVTMIEIVKLNNLYTYIFWHINAYGLI